jgi:hypothetical protein
MRRHTTHRPAQALLLAWAGMLAACGGGGGGGGVDGESPTPPGGSTIIATAADRFFPLDAGSRWTYQQGTLATPVLVKVTGTRATAAGEGTVVISSDPDVGETVYVATDTSVREYSADASDPLTSVFNGLEVLRWPARAGDTWEQLNTNVDLGLDLDGDGRNERADVVARATVVGLATISTPAGRFTGCLHHVQTLNLSIAPSTGGPRVRVESRVETWLAPGIGPVQTLTRVDNAGSVVASTDALTGWRVGASASDSTAPAVLSVTPADGAAASTAGFAVTVNFDEPMDGDTLPPGGFSIVDARGATVPGVARIDGSTLRFEAALPWANGDYSAQLTTLTDLLGNALAAPAAWRFTVDGNSPAIVSTVPLTGSSNVPLNQRITLRFSEPLAPASVNPGTVFLRDGFSPVEAELSVAGDELTIAPVGGLRLGAVYELTLGQVTDLAGNPLRDAFVLRFQATQGAFASPVSLLPGFTGEAAAIGDVTGDGLNDLLLSRGPGSPGDALLYLRPGLPGGDLGPAVAVDLGADRTCILSSLAIGDLDGDGRQDVVAGADFCGIQVLLQDASGTLQSAQILSGRGDGRVRLADLNGDGRLDVVGVSRGSMGLSIWYQGADRRLSAALNLYPEMSGPSDIEVGDLNGDGRPDLAVAVSSSFDDNLAVIYQQADGSFGQPQYLGAGFSFSASGLAIGDLNNDGRSDLAVAGGGNAPVSLGLFFQTASGALGPLVSLPTLDIPTGLRAADLNGDGLTDLVVSHQGFSRVGVYQQRAAGGFDEEALFAAPYGNFNPHALAVGDLNQDGLPDIVLQDEWLRQFPRSQPLGFRPGPRPSMRVLADSLLRGLR